MPDAPRRRPRWQMLERDRVWDFLIEKPTRDELLSADHGYILYLEDVTVSFDGFKALDALTLYVEIGELRCIIGPNGAGKTTMMDVITGKTRPDAGAAYYGQRLDLTRLSEPEIAALGIGRKFQKPTVFENHTAFENLELAMSADKRVWPTLKARLSGEQRDRIEGDLGYDRPDQPWRWPRGHAVAWAKTVARDRHAADAEPTGAPGRRAGGGNDTA